MFDVLVEKDSKANEIIRVQIDKVNVESQNIKLKNKLELMNEEITKLEDDYNKKSARIRTNHKALEKKQLEMDKLNKDYGELMKNKKGEDEGKFEVEKRYPFLTVSSSSPVTSTKLDPSFFIKQFSVIKYSVSESLSLNKTGDSAENVHVSLGADNFFSI